MRVSGRPRTTCEGWTAPLERMTGLCESCSFWRHSKLGSRIDRPTTNVGGPLHGVQYVGIFARASAPVITTPNAIVTTARYVITGPDRSTYLRARLSVKQICEEA
jgi:hypothetical protein